MGVADQDTILQKIEKWFEQEEYDKVVKTAYSIPKEQWNHKLWFFVIGCYNNQGDFKNAEIELAQLWSICQEKENLALWYYMKGYIYYALQREALADWYFRHALENDSNLDAAIELHSLCEKVLEEQWSVSRQLLDINIRALDSLLNEREKKKLKNCSKEEFTLLLGFPSLAGKLPSIDDMGTDIFYQCKSKREKQDAKEFLQNTFGIFDMKSLVEQTSKAFVNGEQFEEFQKVWNQKQEEVLLEDMEVEDKAAFETYLEFAALFPEQVKETGVYAADLSDKITLLRAAYACDIISNSEFLSGLLYFGEEAMNHYHSWREYLIGYLCGKSYARYVMRGADMRGTLQYMDNFLKVLSDIECFDYQWYEEK